MDASVDFARHLLQTVVSLHVSVPRTHPSARILGNERMGSGVVIDPAGLILTVNYVVMGARRIRVTLTTGRRLDARLVAQDFESGLAVLRVASAGLTAATLGSSEQVRLGTPVFAIGAQGPTERRVASGLVTDLGEFDAYWEYLLDRGIVSSAANPGFGGGPLFDLSGAVVGVVSLNLEGIGRESLAIPVEHFTRHRRELLAHGRVTSRPPRAWIGVFPHPVEEGLVVAGLVPGNVLKKLKQKLNP